MSKLQQQIGPVQGIGLIMTALLGTSVFVVPAMSVTHAGTTAGFAWLIVIVIMLPVALTFAELGKTYPHAGGTSHYLGKAFGQRMENFSAWLFLSILPTGLPPAIYFASSYLHQLLPEGAYAIDDLSYFILLALAIMALLGVKISGLVQTAIAVIVCLMFFSIIILADWQLSDLPIERQNIQTAALASSIAIIFWAFVGIEAVAHLGAEFKNPRRDYPLAIVVGIVVVGLLYLIAVFAVIRYRAYGDEVTDSASMALVFAGMLGEPGRLLSSALAFICCFAVMNVYMMSLTRMIYSMARNGVLPGKLACIDRRGIPRWAASLTLTVALATLLMKHHLGFNVQQFMIYTNGVFVTLYLLAMIAGFVLLKGYQRWLALLAALLCLPILASIGWSILYALSVLAFSIAWDRFRQGKNKDLARPAGQADKLDTG